jgi:hypothetical protein
MKASSLLRFVLPLVLLASQSFSATVSGLTGQSATFSASASGTAPFSYQWYKNGAAISGATSSSYAISALATTDSADYSVKVSNTAGSALSTATTLSVSAPVIAPSITSQPASQTLALGAAASFSVTASGTAPFTYQWSKDGGLIAGATSSTYSIAATASSDAGSYTVVVTNSAGSVTSSAASLALIAPPSISSQPASVTTVAGNSASFSVSASGTAPFSYQWYLNGSAITGATSSSYTIAAVTSLNAGTYTVTVSNSAGSVTSSSASLSLIAAPVITGQPASITVASGKSAGFSVTVSGTAPFSYQWMKNGSSILGATGSTYSISSVSSSSAGSYAVIVTNAAGSVASNSATLTVASAPVIVTQPISLSIYTGKPASFTVVATSSSTLSYQWYKSGKPINGANSATYSIASVASTDAASYSVTVSNSIGSVKSSSASLTVTTSPTFNRIRAVSVRTVVDSVNTASVVGFGTDGANTRRLLVRAVGPGLSAYGVSNVLAQPKIEIHSTVSGVDTILATNSGWKNDTTVSEAIVESGAFPLASGSADAAVVITVSAGNYTVVTTGISGSVGTALVEIYELP